MIFCENCILLVLILFLCASDYCSFTSYNYSRKFVIDFFYPFFVANFGICCSGHFFCKFASKTKSFFLQNMLIAVSDNLLYIKRAKFFLERKSFTC